MNLGRVHDEMMMASLKPMVNCANSPALFPAVTIFFRAFVPPPTPLPQTVQKLGQLAPVCASALNSRPQLWQEWAASSAQVRGQSQKSSPTNANLQVVHVDPSQLVIKPNIQKKQLSKYHGPKPSNCGKIGRNVNLPEWDFNTGLAWQTEIHHNLTQLYPWLQQEYQPFPVKIRNEALGAGTLELWHLGESSPKAERADFKRS